MEDVLQLRLLQEPWVHRYEEQHTTPVRLLQRVSHKMFHKVNLLVFDVGEQEHIFPDRHVGLPQSNVTVVEKPDITVVFVDPRYRQPLIPLPPRRPETQEA